jgi:hypothetical protein
MTIGIMPHLTANQAMVLLDIYRGTIDPARHTGTVQHDLIMLLHKEYIQIDSAVGTKFSTTICGEERVKHMLN